MNYRISIVVEGSRPALQLEGDIAFGQALEALEWAKARLLGTPISTETPTSTEAKEQEETA